ncbi:MAG: DinB family protein [Saprospiraceae bacterium]|nr:DinB family protein [Saprospiraceae bacterium]
MTFSTTQALEILERTPDALHTMLHQISEDWTYQNEGPDTWSVFDVVGHLLHGEKTDWIPRATLILSDRADKTFEPFDRFAQYETSKGKNIQTLLEEFRDARKESLSELRRLNISDADLRKTGIHPTFGEVTLAQLLSTWVVHDLNHVAQIARIMAKQYKEEVGPWTAFLRILQ